MEGRVSSGAEGQAGWGFVMDGHSRRLKDLVHAFGTKSALDQITDGDGTDKGSETRILALFLNGTLLENLGWEERLYGGGDC